MNAIKPNNIDEYIASFTEELQYVLQDIRRVIKTTAPNAKEIISYGMPAFKSNGVLVYFAAYKNHQGLYALPSGNTALQKELLIYKTGKGSIQFPLNKPMTLDVVSK